MRNKHQVDPYSSDDEIQDFLIWKDVIHIPGGQSGSCIHRRQLDDIMCLFQNQQEHETKRTGIKSAASVQKANVSTTDGLSIQCYYN